MNIVILAAGKGKRMHSDLPKVLQPVAGEPMVSRVIRTASALNPARTVVVIGHGVKVSERLSLRSQDSGSRSRRSSSVRATRFAARFRIWIPRKSRPLCFWAMCR